MGLRYSQPAEEALKENYQLCLTITDKEKEPVEISIVVASSPFSATYGEENITFSGNVAAIEAEILISYAIRWEPAGKTLPNGPSSASNAQGSVRLKLGEDVQIVRTGTRVARLSMKKLEPGK